MYAALSEVDQHTEHSVLKPGEKTSNATCQTSYMRERAIRERRKELRVRYSESLKPTSNADTGGHATFMVIKTTHVCTWRTSHIFEE